MAPRKKKYNILLTEEDYRQIKDLLAENKLKVTLRTRCEILLDLDEVHGEALSYTACSDKHHLSHSTIAGTAKKYIQEGLDGVLKLNRNINSDRAMLKMNDELTERMLQILQTPPPEGKKRWTCRLLAAEFDGKVSKDAIHRALERNHIKLNME